MSYLIERAVHDPHPVKMLLAGGPGTGKTLSSLRVARALAGPWGRVVVLDADAGARAHYYAGWQADAEPPLAYDRLDLAGQAPDFRPSAYVDALQLCAREGYDVVVVDGLSQAWSGVGGLLDQRDRLAAAGRDPWPELVPQHRALVRALQTVPVHVIATVRLQRPLLQDDPPSVLRIDQREDLRYEFDVVGVLDECHSLRITKSRCHDLAGAVFAHPGAMLGDVLRQWSEGAEGPPWGPFDMPTAAGVPRSVFDAVCQLRGWRWQTWTPRDQRRCVADHDFAAIAQQAVASMKALFHARIPRRPTKREHGDGWAAAVVRHEAIRRACLRSWYGIDSATQFTLADAVGRHGLRWLSPANHDAVRAAWHAVARPRLAQAA